MSLSLSDWHLRYQEQAGWTSSLRKYLFAQANLDQAKHVLEVGCGTGAILAELESIVQFPAIGVDISLSAAHFARANARQSMPICANGYALPFPDQFFDITMAHFLLLWVQHPSAIVQEMVRVTQPGGSILLLAEPDYGGRLDFPNDLAQIGTWQTQALQQQGANPFIGRELTTLLRMSGVTSIQAGVLGGQWNEQDNQNITSLEWKVILSDLASLPSQPTSDEINRLRRLDQASRENGTRVLFTPTFYAWGKV